MRILEHQTPASLIIAKLGGLTRTARLLSKGGKRVAVSTVQGWKERGQIPQGYWPDLIRVAKETDVDLTFEMFLGVGETAN